MLLVEPCTGSAALARRVCGLGRLVSYMGGKDGYADAIIAEWGLHPPSRVVLNDPGLWGLIWEGVLAARSETAGVLRVLARDEPREVFERGLRISSTDDASPLNTALSLCRIAGTYGGCEIGGFKGKHKLRPNVDGFIPCRKTIADRVERMIWPIPVVVTRVSALIMEIPALSWVYVDPPYSGTTGYLSDLDRADLLKLALRYVGVARSVAISEGEPLSGWNSVCLTRRRSGQYRKNSRSRDEYLSISEAGSLTVGARC